uniref:Dolichol phosphate-mannose biosynthesis regulatory protein n=1 Tax=Ditylenchus dipsaci TaxID=166011 RepID=A0A915EQA2_9BILA
MVRSFNFEELAGYSILAITIPSISYLLLWIFGVPFIPDESILRAFFPSQIHGVIIPLSLFWIITIIGVFRVLCLKCILERKFQIFIATNHFKLTLNITGDSKDGGPELANKQ